MTESKLHSLPLIVASAMLLCFAGFLAVVSGDVLLILAVSCSIGGIVLVLPWREIRLRRPISARLAPTRPATLLVRRASSNKGRIMDGMHAPRRIA